MKSLLPILCVLCGFTSLAFASPATLVKAASLDVMSGNTVFGHRRYPAGTPVDVSPALNGQVLVKADDGATALLPVSSVLYTPTPTPKPTAPAIAATKNLVANVESGTADLMTLSGKLYKQARVFRAEPDGIIYAFAGGMAKILFTDLSEDIRRQYNFDPEKARKFAEQDAAMQQQLANSQTALQRAMQEAKDTDDLMAKIQFRMVGKIRQLTDEGALMDASVEQEIIRTRDVDVSTGLERRTAIQDYRSNEFVRLNEPVFVYGISGNYVDGDSWTGLVWTVGTYRYTTVMSVGKTVRAFSANKNRAVQLIRASVK